MASQDSWKWCNKCQTLAFAGGASMGACPAGGQHDHAGSGNYALFDNDIGAFGQPNWRWCNKCQSLSFAGSASLGACKSGGVHDHTGSGNYSVGQTSDGMPGQSNWRWCNKCQVLSFAGSPTMGACAAGGQHDHSNSGNYVLQQVPDCRVLQAEVKDLEDQITAIQNSPGYIQGPEDPNPGRPDPESLADVKDLQQQLAPKATALAGCVKSYFRALSTFCDTAQCVSTASVYANIAARLNNKVVGYSCYVGRSQNFGLWGGEFSSWGEARTDANSPRQSFTHKTKMTVASVSKVVTTLVAIKVLAQNGISLNSTIAGHLPASWKLDPNVAAITFRQLLGQRSGIKDYGNVSMDYSTLKKFFTQTVDTTKNTSCQGPGVINPADPINVNDKTWCYSNYNFAIFRILLPTITGTADDADALAKQYVKLAQKNVFEPVGVFDADAKPPANNNTYSYAYTYPGTSGGHDFGDNTSIVGAAGWYFSVEDIVKVLVSLNKNDGKILSSAQLNDMDTNQLGWDKLIDATGYRWVEKNGKWSSGTDVVSTSIGLLGPGVIGVLFLNSDISGEPTVIASGVLYQEYMKALQAKAAAAGA